MEKTNASIVSSMPLDTTAHKKELMYFVSDFQMAIEPVFEKHMKIVDIIMAGGGGTLHTHYGNIRLERDK